MKLYGNARTDPQLRCQGMNPPTHTPDPDDMRELCGLAACLRAWASTPGDQPDAGREHALYPTKQYRPGLGSNEGPLWSAIECVLARHGFGKEHF